MYTHAINHLDNMADESFSVLSGYADIEYLAYIWTCNELIETYDMHGNLLFMTFGEIEC